MSTLPAPATALPQPPPLAPIVHRGLVRAAPLHVVMAEQIALADAKKNEPVMSSLASHVRQRWSEAKQAKLNSGVQERMLAGLRQRRGEYDPDKKSAIAAVGGSDIYIMLTSVKCRAAASWIRDVMLGTGSAKPWEIGPTPVPELPPDVNDEIVKAAAQAMMPAIEAGIEPTEQEVRTLLETVKQEAKTLINEEAMRASKRMEIKMEDQLIEGGLLFAVDQMVDDLTTFPSALIKGPIVRKKPRLQWVMDEATQKYTAKVEMTFVNEWERCDPLRIYPSPGAATVNNGGLIEHHQLYRQDLNDLIGVDGYHEASIRAVLDKYSTGLKSWLSDDSAIAAAEGKSPTALMTNAEGTIDALQFWGSVPGQLLVEWGMPKEEVPDPTREYHVEAWLIGEYIIKAVLNYDPLGRKPYYKASYEDVPGSWWGNSVCDLVRDPQDMGNAAARALVNNMGMASGPQVAIIVDRLAAGETVDTLHPWKTWQMTADPFGGTAPPIYFFQPDSRTAELMAIIDRAMQMADEHSGIPRYLSGDTTGGAGRTASGLSMLIGNAGKGIKQVIGNVDINVFQPLLERQYEHNMQFSDDAELKGDIQIVAKGASSLIAKETAQVRRAEFLMATNNPTDLQITGLEGRAEVLRAAAVGLDLAVERIVPSNEVLKARWSAAAAQAAQQLAAAQGTPAKPSGNGQALMDGAPVTDNFSPT